MNNTKHKGGHGRPFRIGKPGLEFLQLASKAFYDEAQVRKRLFESWPGRQSSVKEQKAYEKLIKALEQLDTLNKSLTKLLKY